MTPEYSHAAVSQKLSQQYSRQCRVRPPTSSAPSAFFRHSALHPSSPLALAAISARTTFLVAKTHRIAQPQPDEMCYLVDENPGKLRARAVQSDSPFAQKRPRMHRPAPVPQTGHEIDPHWRTGQRWHTPHDRRNPRVREKETLALEG